MKIVGNNVAKSCTPSIVSLQRHMPIASKVVPEPVSCSFTIDNDSITNTKTVPQGNIAHDSGKPIINNTLKYLFLLIPNKLIL